jgi:hypothetical protein
MRSNCCAVKFQERQEDCVMSQAGIKQKHVTHCLCLPPASANFLFASSKILKKEEMYFS